MQLTATMNEVELSKVLEATISSDIVAIQSAQRYLENAAASNVSAPVLKPWFRGYSDELLLGALSNRLADGKESQNARKAAAIQLKNHLTSKDDVVLAQYHQRWMSFDNNNRAAIKHNGEIESLPKQSSTLRLTHVG
eukprot:sb/3474514/